MPAAVVLERRLVYLPLTLADTLDTVLFYGVAVAAAVAGFGVWSFVLGALAGRLAGVATLWIAVRWRPAARWHWRDLRGALSFGVLFHGSALITMVRDAVVPIIVGAWVGLAGVGFVNWATALAFLPLQIVSIAGRVLFPALARLQDDPAGFARATERALNRIALVVYPLALLLMAAAMPIVRFVYGEAWMPAVTAGADPVRDHAGGRDVQSPGARALRARPGRYRLAVEPRLDRAAVGATPLLVPWLGVAGFALSSAAVALTMGATAVALRRLAPVNVLRPVAAPLAAAVVAALGLAGLERCGFTTWPRWWWPRRPPGLCTRRSSWPAPAPPGAWSCSPTGERCGRAEPESRDRAYNHGRYLSGTLDSALGQTCPTEVIVVDDGSTDDTPAVLERFAGRVRVHRQANRGLSAARNVGLELASGRYIAFLDADDVIAPTKLASQAAVLDADPEVGWVYCDVLIDDEVTGDRGWPPSASATRAAGWTAGCSPSWCAATSSR